MAPRRLGEQQPIGSLCWASIVLTVAASVSTAILGVVYVCNTILQLRSPFPQHSPIAFPIFGRAALVLQAMQRIGVVLAVLAFAAESGVQVAREQIWKRQAQPTPSHQSVAAGAAEPPSTGPIWRRIALGLAAAYLWAAMPPSVFDTSGSLHLHSVAIVSQDQAWAVGATVTALLIVCYSASSWAEYAT